VPGEIQNAKHLFDFFYESLVLPGYFGFNWSALSDCLRDLDWISERGVLVVHENIPALPLSEIRIYLEILQDAMLSWREGMNIPWRSCLWTRIECALRVCLRRQRPEVDAEFILGCYGI
jgi:hypothetical protein